MKKKTIYAISSGEYSDYSIRAIFSTREKAEAYKTEFDKSRTYDHADIEEWVLDEQDNHIAGTLYRCRIDIESGTITQEWGL